MEDIYYRIILFDIETLCSVLVTDYKEWLAVEMKPKRSWGVKQIILCLLVKAHIR